MHRHRILRAQRLVHTALAASCASLASALPPAHPDPLLQDQALALPTNLPAGFQTGIVLDGDYHVLDLEFHEVRAPGYRLYVSDASGTRRVANPPPSTTYRGALAGRPGSSAAGWLSPTGLHALILDGNGAWYVSPSEAAARYDVHTVRRVDEVDLPPIACGVEPEREVFGDERGAPPPALKSTTLGLARIAYDIDSAFVNTVGSVAAAQAEVEGRIALGSLLFERDILAQYTITGGMIRTTGNDPYIDVYGLDSSDDMGEWLFFHKQHWNTTSPEKDIPADLVHLFIGYPPLGEIVGLANGKVCVNLDHFAMSLRSTNPEVSLARFAHETGHNWGAGHCTQPDCGIMNTGPGAPLTFDPAAISKMVAYKDDLMTKTPPCIPAGTPSAAPTLTTVSPAQVQAIGGETLTLDGTLDTTLEVEVDGTTLPTESLTLVDPQTIEIAAPRATALGFVDVVASGPGGFSGVEQFEYVETSPPKLVADFYPVWGFDAIWSYGGEVGKTGRLLLAFNPTTTTISGFQVLLNASTADIQVLADPGIATYSRAIPQALAGATLYMQVLLIDGSTLVDVSAIEAYPIAP